MNTISFGEVEIPYRIEKARGRSTMLKFSPQLPILLIRTPNGTLTAETHKFLQKQSKWIIKSYQQHKQKISRRESFKQEALNGSIPYMGVPHTLRFQTGRRREIRREENVLEVTLRPGDAEQDKLSFLYAGLRQLAKSHLTKRTIELARETGSKVNDIRVKDLKSKWGSCSSKRNINLNWYLALMSPNLIDYIIIHELMHLKEMNHSPKFWGWVEHYYPNYKLAERQIRKHEWLIGIFDN